MIERRKMHANGLWCLNPFPVLTHRGKRQKSSQRLQGTNIKNN
jgi:hypothetical protein